MRDIFSREITYLRLSVTDRCNLRCRYCIPESGVKLKEHSQMLSIEEMVTASMACASLGIRKIRVTGGEPLVKRGIVDICGRLASIDGIDEVCITTNGIMLPSFASDLVRAGVRRVNISLDTLRPERYAYMTRMGCLDDAIKGLECALNAGFEKVKVNSVLIGGFNDDEVKNLAMLTMKYPIDIRFIELMPMGQSFLFPQNAFVSGRTVLDSIPELTKDGVDGVSLNYSFDKALGKVGLIEPLSNSFCASCNRIRITADGNIKPCLHSSCEYSIKGLPYEKMLEVIKAAILSKPREHDILGAEFFSHAGRTMNQIGG